MGNKGRERDKTQSPIGCQDELTSSTFRRQQKNRAVAEQSSTRNSSSKKHTKEEDMATSLTTSAAVVGLPSIASPRLKSNRRRSVPSSSFLRGSAPSSSNALLLCSNKARVTCFARDWLRTDLSVIGFGLIGWLAPSSIPAINGESLTGLFFNSIGPELAHWPTGPALSSPFWLWMVTWHLGLFITLTLGQIGFKGRGDGYF